LLETSWMRGFRVQKVQLKVQKVQLKVQLKVQKVQLEGT